jgi:hypothetical protein
MAWAWASRSAARFSKPMVGGCGRRGASRGVLSFSLRSPLTQPSSVIDVAYWHTAAVIRRWSWCVSHRRHSGLTEPGQGHDPSQMAAGDTNVGSRPSRSVWGHKQAWLRRARHVFCTTVSCRSCCAAEVFSGHLCVRQGPTRRPTGGDKSSFRARRRQLPPAAQTGPHRPSGGPLKVCALNNANSDKKRTCGSNGLVPFTQLRFEMLRQG